MKDILTWFSTLSWLKTWLQSTYEEYFNMIFHLRAAQNLVAEHYERDFDMIFHYKEVQNLVAEHYDIDFEIIFHFKEAQNLVAEHLWKIFWLDFRL